MAVKQFVVVLLLGHNGIGFNVGPMLCHFSNLNFCLKQLQFMAQGLGPFSIKNIKNEKREKNLITATARIALIFAGKDTHRFENSLMHI